MNQPKIEWTEHVVDGRKCWKGRAPNGYSVHVTESSPTRYPAASCPVLRVGVWSPWWYGRAVLGMDVAEGLEKAQQHAVELAKDLQEQVERVHGRDVEALKLRFTSRHVAVHAP